MASASALALSAMRNPTVRKLAAQTGAAIVNQAINWGQQVRARRQRRRASRAPNTQRRMARVGRSRGQFPFQGPRMIRNPGNAPQMSTTTRSLQAQPAAWNMSSSNQQLGYPLRGRDPFNGNLVAEADENGERYIYRVNPRQTALFPVLSSQVGAFTTYEFQSLVIEYVPRAGTSQTGRIIMGWDAQAHYADTDYPDTTSIASMSRSVEAPLRESCSLSIPCQGQKFINIPKDTPSYDPTSSYNGTLVFTLQSDEEIKEPGNLYMNYVCVLRGRKIDTSAKAAGYTRNNAEFLANEGRFGLEVEQTGTGEYTLTMCATVPQTLMVMWANTDAVTLTKNGDAVLSTTQFSSASNSFAVFQLGRWRVGDEVVFTFSVEPTVWWFRVVDTVDFLG